MVETELTLKALAYAKEHFTDKADECGKPIIDRLLFVAERMHDELTTCAALLQDIDPVPSGSFEVFSEYPPAIADTIIILNHRERFYYDSDDPGDLFYRDVMTNKSAQKVMLEDLRYRMNRDNYAQLTTDLLNKIKMYTASFDRIDDHIHRKNASGAKYEIKKAVKTACCGKIVPESTRHCPACGKSINSDVLWRQRYEFEKTQLA